MRHQPLEQILDQATPLEAPLSLSRRERLLRWAQALRAEDRRVMHALKFVEFYAPEARARLRAEQTPIAVAYADPVLRAAGLMGDTFGDAQSFFGLSDKEAHFLLCDCHWNGRMTGGGAARRVRAVANPNPINRLWMELRAD